VLIVGAGGAAAGIAPALLDANVREIIIINRTATRAKELVARFEDQRFAAASPDALSHSNAFDLVINATSASLQGKRPNLPDEVIGTETLAYDLVYAKHATPFMDWAASLGVRTADGWGMLVEQAAESFFLWHGIRPDTAPLLRRLSVQGRSEL
jgi:shikimate dehydrogenase